MDSIIVRFDSDRVSYEDPLQIGGQGDNNVLTVRFVLPEVTANQLAYVKLDLATPVKTPLTHNGEYWDWLVTSNVTLDAGKFATQVEIFDAADTLEPVWNSEQFNVEIFESLGVNKEIEQEMLPELLEAEAALQAAIAKTEDILDAVEQEAARETAEAARVTAEQGRVAAEEAREEAFEQFEQNLAGGEYNGATFTPAVSAAGVISWTNDKGLANPTSVNIMGPQGPAGATGATGAAGPQGPQGPRGETGATGPQGPQGAIGPQGPQGPAGADGAPGAKGDKGDKGDTGDSGVYLGSTEPADETVKVWINPDGESSPGLPVPGEDDVGKALVVGADGVYELGEVAGAVDTDTTLSVSGSPADAAATGAAIEAVSPDDESVGAKPWSSKQIIDTLCPPLEVAGNPVQCYPVAGYPLGVTVSWEPRQEGEGDPSPENVRPIVGMDEVQVTHRGINLYNADALVVINGDADIYGYGAPADDLIIGKTYTLSVNAPIFSFKISDNINGYNSVSQDNIVDGKYTFVMVRNSNISNGTTQYVLVSTSSNIIYDLVSLPEQAKSLQISICAGEDAMPYAPYTGTTATLTLPETIYGGELDAVTGVGEQTVDVISLSVADMSGSDEYPGWTNQNWIGNYVQDTNQDVYFQDVADYIASNADGSKKLRFNGNTVYFVSSEFGYTRSEMQSLYPDLIFQFAFKRLLPNPIQATGGQSIPALPGTNTIYTDADSLTVTGRADPVQTINALNDRIAALEDAATGG